jgi:glutamine synthetase
VASAQGMITVEELKEKVAAGEIDTVISAVCDMQGRLVGKRVVASFFLDHLLEHGTHFCTYLLSADELAVRIRRLSCPV